MIARRERVKILIIDDPDEWKDFAVSTLTEAGYEVVAPDRPSEYSSLRKFRNHLQQFALIIVDPILQESDAIDILFRIGQASQSNSTIALTSIPTIGLVKETMRMGIRNISPKPYEKRQLLQIVRNMLEEIGNDARK